MLLLGEPVVLYELRYRCNSLAIGGDSAPDVEGEARVVGGIYGWKPDVGDDMLDNGLPYCWRC